MSLDLDRRIDTSYRRLRIDLTDTFKDMSRDLDDRVHMFCIRPYIDMIKRAWNALNIIALNVLQEAVHRSDKESLEGWVTILKETKLMEDPHYGECLVLTVCVFFALEEVCMWPCASTQLLLGVLRADCVCAPCPRGDLHVVVWTHTTLSSSCMLRACCYCWRQST